MARRHRNTIKLKSLLLMLALCDSRGRITAPSAKRTCDSMMKRHTITGSNWGTELRTVATEGDLEYVGDEACPTGQAMAVYKITKQGRKTAKESIADVVELFQLLHQAGLV